MKSIRPALALAVLCVMSSCATSNPFVRMAPDYTEIPESSLRAAAAEIEAAVAAGDREPVLSQHEGVVLDTPEVVQAIRGRGARAELVHDLLSKGYAYEQSAGLIAIKRSGEYKSATTSLERDRNALIVQSENENRWSLYEGVLKASNWTPRSLSAVQHIFAQERIPHLPQGAIFEREGE
ncbi:MAG: DUF1318 domain-containing protein [Candidatus Hydrogenedens sp.]|nr:DUF1318 domain-containing protein [Candidatus Hydrogenedens sp.]